MHLNRAAPKRTQSYHKHKEQLSRSVSILARRPTKRPARRAGSGVFAEYFTALCPAASAASLQTGTRLTLALGADTLLALLCSMGRCLVSAIPT
jgi:hypothetical protein